MIVRPDEGEEVIFPKSEWVVHLDNKQQPLAFLGDIQVWSTQVPNILLGYDEENVPRGPIIVSPKVAEYMIREDKERLKPRSKIQPHFPKHALIFVPDSGPASAILDEKGQIVAVKRLMAYRWQVESK